MASISGGGRRIGGPNGPEVPAPVGVEGPKKESLVSTERQPAERQLAEAEAMPASDGFDRANLQNSRLPGDMTKPGVALKSDGEAKFNDLLKQMRGDPKSLAGVMSQLNAAIGRLMSEFNGDFKQASVLLDRLAQNNFSQAAIETLRSELASLRERLALTRQRITTQKRRQRALKQLAGRISDMRLAEEIASIRASLEQLETSWAQNLVRLGLGTSIYQEGENIPAHLRRVIKTTIQGGKKGDTNQLGEILSGAHPARIVAGIAAREIDCKTPLRLAARVIRKVIEDKGGVHGRQAQACAALFELFEKNT